MNYMDIIENIDIETIAAEIENCRKDVENILAAINEIQDKLNLYREQIKETEEKSSITGELSDYSYTKPSSISIEGQKIAVKAWKNVLIEACTYINNNYRKIFETFPNDKDMQGRSRKYFSKDKNAAQFHSMLIPNSEIYVETNFSANDIMDLVKLMLGRCGIATFEIDLDGKEIAVKTGILFEENTAQEQSEDVEYRNDKFNVYFSSKTNAKRISVALFRQIITEMREQDAAQGYFSYTDVKNNVAVDQSDMQQVIDKLRELDVIMRWGNYKRVRYQIKDSVRLQKLLDNPKIIIETPNWDWDEKIEQSEDKAISVQKKDWKVFVTEKVRKNKCPICARTCDKEKIKYNNYEGEEKCLIVMKCKVCNRMYINESLYYQINNEKQNVGCKQSIDFEYLEEG